MENDPGMVSTLPALFGCFVLCPSFPTFIAVRLCVCVHYVYIYIYMCVCCVCVNLFSLYLSICKYMYMMYMNLYTLAPQLTASFERSGYYRGGYTYRLRKHRPRSNFTKIPKNLSNPTPRHFLQMPGFRNFGEISSLPTFSQFKLKKVQLNLSLAAGISCPFPQQS